MNLELKKSNPPLYKEKIDLVRSLIIESVDKEILKKVYLFGSYAYGEPDGQSDLDLCVVISDNSKRSDAYLDIAIALNRNDIILYDLLVYNEKYFYGAKNPKGVEHTIMETGELLYG